MALQNVKWTLPHGFTLTFLEEELFDEGPTAQFRGSGTRGLRQAMLHLDRYIIELRLRPGLIGLKT